MRIRTLLPVVALAVVVGVALDAIQASAPPARHAVHATYSATEVLEFLLFSTGRVVADHPELAEPRAPAMLATDSQAHVVAESVSRCVNLMDATAGPALTAAFNAGDPQRIDGAVQRVDAVARRWLTAPYKLDDPCPDPPPPPKYGGEYHDPGGSGWWRMNGEGYLNYIFYGQDFYLVAVTVGGALVISGIGLVAFAVVLWVTAFWVPVVPSYVFENKPTELDHQIAIAKVAQALRS